MSDLVEKCRPTRFEDVRGQSLAVRWCQNQIRTGRGQSVLFSGPLGVGKTSLALIYAKARFCEGPNKEQSPCGECRWCKQFGDRGVGFGDFTRLNCGEKSGVDDVRKVLETAGRPAWDTKYRVVFLDEVHNLSQNACDALLKPLETPYSWGPTFILATTKPDKVPPPSVRE